jgi:Tol biopolymer transport system component
MPSRREERLVLTDGVREEALREETSTYRWPRFSPDGQRVAVAVSARDGAAIWSYDIAAKTFTRLARMSTFDGPGRLGGIGTPGVPEWTADSRRVIYRNVSDGNSSVLSVAIDGSTKPETLYVADFSINEAILSTDDRWLILRTGPGGTRPRDIFAVDLKGDRALIPIATGPASELMPRLSPDGRWLAYQTDESGRSEVVVRPFPADGARIQVSTEGGVEPLWDRTGRTLYYRSAEGIVATAVTTGSSFTIGARRLALRSTARSDGTHPAYDITPDGKRFLIVRGVATETKGVVVHNWARELRERLQGVAP